MRKSFPLEVENLKPPRVIESVKHQVRKYLKRERRKPLPEEVDFWDFDCRAGKDSESAAPLHVNELTAAIDTAAREQWKEIYIEILAKPGTRQGPFCPRPQSGLTPSTASPPVPNGPADGAPQF